MITKEARDLAAFIMAVSMWLTTVHSQSRKEPSRMTHYILSNSAAQNRREAYDICQSLGGNLLNLETSHTAAFLQQFSESPNVSDYEGIRFYTSLRFVDGIFIWDEFCKIASEQSQQFATSDNTDYSSVNSAECFQIVFRPNWIEDPKVDVSGRWCSCDRSRRFICEIRDSDPCEIEEHDNVASIKGLEEQISAANPEECRVKCLNYVQNETECWYFKNIDKNCYIWLSHKQPIHHPFEYREVQPIPTYSKNCITWEIEETLERGPHSISRDYETCEGGDPTVPDAKAADVDKMSAPQEPPSDRRGMEMLDDVITPDQVKNPGSKLTDTQTQPIVDPQDLIRNLPVNQVLPEITTDKLTTINPNADLQGSLLPSLEIYSVEPDIAAVTEDLAFYTPSVKLELPVSLTESNIAVEKKPVTRLPEETSLPAEIAPVITAEDVGYVSLCECLCPEGANRTDEEKVHFTEELVANLTIDVKNTSANIRKYVSANDPRPSARNIGGVGAGLLSIVFGGLVVPDFLTFTAYVYKLVQRWTSRKSVIQIHIPSPLEPKF